MTKTWRKTISSLHNCNRAYRIRMLSDLYRSRSFDHKVSIYFQYFKVKMVITRELIWKMCSHERLHLAAVSMMRCVAETNVFSKSPHDIPKITNPKILLAWTMWEEATALNKNGAPLTITRGVGIFRKTKGAKKDDGRGWDPYNRVSRSVDYTNVINQLIDNKTWIYLFSIYHNSSCHDHYIT